MMQNKDFISLVYTKCQREKNLASQDLFEKAPPLKNKLKAPESPRSTMD
jgi:hypothetical protein